MNALMEKNRRVLIIDDNRLIHDDFRKILAQDNASQVALEANEADLFGTPVHMAERALFEVDSAYQGEEGVLLVKTALEAGLPYAMAFVDVRMPPGIDGLETTRKIWELDSEIQIVLCTAYSDVSWDVILEKIGDTDRMVILKKPFDTVEAFQLAQALTQKWWLSRQARGKMEELEGMVAERTRELQESNDMLQMQARVIENMSESVIIANEQGQIVITNPMANSMFGYGSGELIGQNVSMLNNPAEPENQRIFSETWTGLQNGQSWSGEVSRLKKDGTAITVRAQIGSLELLGRRHFFAIQEDVTQRKLAEDELRQKDALIRIAGQVTHTGGWAMLVPEQRLFWSDEVFNILGYPCGDVPSLGDALALHPEPWRDKITAAMEACTAKGTPFDIEVEILGAHDRRLWVRVCAEVERRADGSIERVLGAFQDITGQKKLEAMLFQSQKMETVGKLAGGFAHEFNSILTAIIGQSELLATDLPPGSILHGYTTEIRRAADRAAGLTRQLLAYGRKQILRLEILDLNTVLSGMDVVLRHLIDPNTDLRILPASGLSPVKVDAGQIEQVIVNIVMNAVDAMPTGGKLTIETSNVSLDQNYVEAVPDLKAGDYIMLAITDSGIGMSKETMAHIFDPFFTTKAAGIGTGLGLSTCYGILKQSGGHISVCSEEGRGATFKIYLPSVELAVKSPLTPLDVPQMPGGSETILLVEDDSALREIAAILLQRLGYNVLTAANGLEALDLAHQQGRSSIDLILTDVAMTEMGGKELSDRISPLYPGTKILFTSAYVENASIHQGVLNEGVDLLQKPFTPTELAVRIREMLDKKI